MCDIFLQFHYMLIDNTIISATNSLTIFICSGGSDDDSPVVLEVMEGILSQAMPTEASGVHVQVSLTSLQLLGELNEYLGHHPDLLAQVLSFCTARLHDPRLATAASKVTTAI